MKTGRSTDEVAYWDYWNEKYRTASPEERSAAAQTAWLAIDEVEALRIDAASILEAGCGTGWLAQRLAGGFSRYIGLDLSPSAIKLAQERGTKAEFVATDFLTWQGLAESFEVVIMVDTIAYFRDQNEALRRAGELLRPGGYLVLTTVNPFVYSRMSAVGPPGKGQVRRWLTRQALHDLLAQNGFKVVKSYTAFPAGDRGILRFVNSRKGGRVASLIGVSRWMTRTKESLGLGQYRVVVARRAPQGS